MQRSNHRRSSARAWYWAFLIPLALVVAVPFYNRVDPTLFGMPFFYWSQFALVVIGALVTGIVYVATPEQGEAMPRQGDAS